MWNCKLNHCQECSHTIRWVVYQRRLMASLSASFQSQSGSMIKVDTSYGAGAPLGSTSPSKFGMESPTKLATGSLLKKTFVGACKYVQLAR